MKRCPITDLLPEYCAHCLQHKSSEEEEIELDKDLTSMMKRLSDEG